jgi:hypothetical protein
MQGIRGFMLICLVLNFVQCKKDTIKVEPVLNILENGLYQFHYQTSIGGEGYPIYYLKGNKFFGNYDRKHLCIDREAGSITKIGNEIQIPSLYWQSSSAGNPCVFLSDEYGGDTLIFHLYDILEYQDHNGKNALKGSFFYMHPFPTNFYRTGSFTLNYTPIQ